jgi:DNA polymerase/3'-5' exonuclease PolX
MFDKMSKLHQSCPLLRDDNWKAYSFNVTAGRLRNIDFDIVDDPIVMKKLRGVKGIGASSVGKIQEYFNTGSMIRIKEFETDPKRVAMKKMMDIWGVGRVKVRRLLYSSPM